MYKDILGMTYAGYFVNKGFSLKKLDKHLQYISPDEKAIMLDNVLNALDLDLQKFSSE